jgi:hypothetical protein
MLMKSFANVWCTGLAWLALSLVAACSGTDAMSSSGDSLEAPPSQTGDSSATGGTDSTVTPPPDTSSTVPSDSSSRQPGDSSAAAAGSAPGIVFGSFDVDNAVLGVVQTGGLRTPDENSILKELNIARSHGARFVLKLSRGGDRHVKNADGTFNFDKWKQMVDRYKGMDLSSFIADGTILGHYLLDEPNLASRWGGQIIPQATVEAMAAYSKQLWPGMTTFIRVVPSWLAKANIHYQYLDGAWAQYTARKGAPAQWLLSEVAVARQLGLGLMVGMNVLDGGDGSSGVHGTVSGRYSMTADEIRNYGSALLGQSYACGFIMWNYDGQFFGRSDIASAMADISAKAKTHPRTSCRQ